MIPSSAVADLRTRLDGMSDRLRVASVPVHVDPLDLVRAGHGAFGTAGFFSAPGGAELGGLGWAWRSDASGHERLRRVAASVRELDAADSARLLVGFSFAADGPRGPEWDGFPGATVLLPEIMAVRDHKGARLVVAVAPDRDGGSVLAALEGLEVPPEPRLPEPAGHVAAAEPAPAEWREQVAEAVGAVSAGSLAKVVLSRAVRVSSDSFVPPFDLVHHLRSRFSQCYAFGWSSGDATFLGASPELLVARTGDDVRCYPLAGTTARGIGDADEHLGYEMLLSPKQRVEHRLVVEDVVARLRPHTVELAVQDQPSVRQLANVQHLATQVTGRLATPRSILDLAGDLHPTPAVGGTPRSEALAYIDKVESADRGWYAGGIGWVDGGGDGELAVALRCALVRDGEAYLHAGAGIVGESDPDAELAETRLKFGALLDLLAAP